MYINLAGKFNDCHSYPCMSLKILSRIRKVQFLFSPLVLTDTYSLQEYLSASATGIKSAPVGLIELHSDVWYTSYQITVSDNFQRRIGLVEIFVGGSRPYPVT